MNIGKCWTLLTCSAEIQEFERGRNEISWSRGGGRTRLAREGFWSINVPTLAVSQSPYAAFFLGTLAPFLRASDRPIAIACFLLFTLPPLPLRPERRVPCFFRRIALATLFPAPLLYLRPRDFFLAGIVIPFLGVTGV